MECLNPLLGSWQDGIWGDQQDEGRVLVAALSVGWDWQELQLACWVIAGRKACMGAAVLAEGPYGQASESASASERPYLYEGGECPKLTDLNLKS